MRKNEFGSILLRKRLFAEEYVKDLNAGPSAIRAGYSKNSARQCGERLLRDPYVQDLIRAHMKERSERTKITADMVLQELAKIGFSDIRRVVRWQDEDGQSKLALVDSEMVDDGTSCAIAEVSEGPHGLKIKMYDKLGALVNIGRHLGMFKEKVEISGPDGAPVSVAPMTKEEYKAARKEMLKADDC